MKLTLLLAAFAATAIARNLPRRLISQDPNATPEEIEQANKDLSNGDLTPTDLRVLNGSGSPGADDACVCDDGSSITTGSCTQADGCTVRQFPSGSGVGFDNLCVCSS